jgi:dTDP-4-dehydrorhamnose reductase
MKEIELKTQIYHFSNEGNISWFDFAKEVFILGSLDCKVIPILSEQYKTLAKRPKNSTLNKRKIIDSGITLCQYRKSIENCLKNINYDNKAI